MKWPSCFAVPPASLTMCGVCVLRERAVQVVVGCCVENNHQSIVVQALLGIMSTIVLTSTS
jgi:hypothetical protein